MNKKVLVTGSTKGIGQGILKKFHEENWDVCVTGRNNQQVTKLENELNEIRKNSAIGLGIDLGLKSEINKLFNIVTLFKRLVPETIKFELHVVVFKFALP